MDSLLAHCSATEAGRHFFQTWKLQSPIEFANYFDSQEDVRKAASQTWDQPAESLVLQLCEMWSLANVWADHAAQLTAQSFDEHPVTRSSACSSTHLPHARQQLSIAPRALPSAKFSRRRCTSTPQGAVSQNIQRSARLAEKLWSLFIEIGVAGSLWTQYQGLSEALRLEFRESKLDSWNQLPTSCLSRAVSTANRWTRWCLQSGVQPWMPTPLEVGLWLRSLRRRGPTSPRGVLTVLRWLQLHLGAVFHAELDEVARHGVIEPGHEAMPATPMTISMWVKLEQILADTSSGDAVKMLCATWIFLLVGCVRFAHIQRSSLTQCFETGLEFFCNRGKARVRGVQAPFRWSMPRHGITGIDLYQVWSSIVLRVFGDLTQLTFILPDFAPSRVTLDKVRGLDAIAMPLWKFVRMSRSLFHMLGFDCQHRGRSTALSYMSRRVLPTLADMSSFKPRELLAVGAWVDSKRPSMQAISWRLAMPLRYSDKKLLVARQLKSELVIAARLALNAWRSRYGDSAPTWDDLLPLWPKRSFAQRHVVKSQQRIVDARTDDPASSSSAESTPSIGTSVAWLLPTSGARCKLHLQSEHSCNMGQCGKKFSRPEDGVGLDAALATGRSWSPTCFRRLPESAREAWKRFGEVQV